MKLIYKNQKIKIFSLLLMLVGMISLGFFVQSCTEDALDNNMNEDMSINAKYLDLDVISTTAFTKTQLDLMANAVQRITDHLVFDKENNKYVFGLKSPAEINVSERLFNYIYSGMGVYTKNTMLRFKGDTECKTTWGIGYYQTTCTLTDRETKDLLQAVKAYLSGIGGVAQLATIIEAFKTTPYATVITALVGAYTYLETSHVDSIYDKYVNSSQTGSTYTTTTFTASTVPYTTYQFTFK